MRTAGDWSAYNGPAVLFGGADATGRALGDTWLWDGYAWSEAPAKAPPPPRAGGLVCQCDTLGALLLFGGLGPGPGGAIQLLDDTWLWNGSAWSASPGQGPEGRAGGAAAFDPVRGQVVLFGGSAPERGAQYAGDTWLWRDGIWTAAGPASSPAPRLGAAMTFDQSLERVLLFGGGGGSLFGETWSWDGSNWHQHATGHSPAARQGAGMVFHQGLGATLLFGGSGVPPGPGSAGLNDTWLFGGSDWEPLDQPTFPPAGDIQLWYDAAAGKALLLSTTGGKSFDSASGEFVLEPYRASVWLL